MKAIGQLYVSLAPVIFAGIFNMLWVKLPFLKAWAIPMDGGKHLDDGERILGDNQTWKGFFGMVWLGALAGILWGLFLKGHPWQASHLIMERWGNRLGVNALAGGLLGLVYALAELPNSFLKRRLRIKPGKNPPGAWKPFFIALDQVDSVLACILALALVVPLTPATILGGTLLGGITHIVINMTLYVLHLRKNPF